MSTGVLKDGVNSLSWTRSTNLSGKNDRRRINICKNKNENL